MADQSIPNEAPPSYTQATGAASSSSRPNASTSDNTGHLNLPGSSPSGHAIDPAHRRSMEDEGRPLPKGWVRQFDSKVHHQFFVDTNQDPPRSIWVHPYDDEEYLRTLSAEERERIEQESMGRGHPPSKQDMIAHDTDEEDEHDHDHHAGASSSTLPPRADGKKTFGRKLKDKVTGMTHEERAEQRKRRAEEEKRMYEQHQRVRQAMARAAETGQPQLIGKDRDGKDVYVEPPAFQSSQYGGYGSGYGYNPYNQGGVYSTPNARYIRPGVPYGRPYGGGFGGGYGLPLALGGGLMGGMLLGDMAMGGFGGGFGGGGF